MAEGSTLADWVPTAMIVAGAALSAFVVLRLVIRNRRARRERSEWDDMIAQRERYRASEPVKRGPPAASDSSAPAPQRADRLDLDRVESRIAVLQRLVRDADARIARLEALRGTTPTAARAKPAPAVADAQAEWADAAARTVYRLADEGHDSATIARLTGTSPGHVELMLAIRRD